jgi:hypothetical protein
VPTRPTYAQERLHEAVSALACSDAPLRERLARALRLAERARAGPGLSGRLLGEFDALVGIASSLDPVSTERDRFDATLAAMDDAEALAVAETLVELSWQLARQRFAPTAASIRQARDAGFAMGGAPEISLVFKCPACRSEVDFGVGRGEEAPGDAAMRGCRGCGAALSLVAVGDDLTVMIADVPPDTPALPLP